MEKNLFALVCSSILLCATCYSMDNQIACSSIDNQEEDFVMVSAEDKEPQSLAHSVVEPVSPSILATLSVATKVNGISGQPVTSPPSSPLSPDPRKSPTSLTVVSLENGTPSGQLPTLPAPPHTPSRPTSPKKLSPSPSLHQSPAPEIEMHKRRPFITTAPPITLPESYQNTQDSLAVVNSKSSLTSPSPNIKEPVKCGLLEWLFYCCFKSSAIKNEMER